MSLSDFPPGFVRNRKLKVFNVSDVIRKTLPRDEGGLFS